MEGRGTIVYFGGTEIFEGYWHNDRRDGMGRLITMLGDVSEGNFVNEQLSG